MRLAIQKHLRDFVAVFFMALVALGVSYYILSQQRFHLPHWVPVVGSSFYKLNVELQTGQAVVPGQGQTIDIAGVKVGDVSSVTLHNGVAVVSVNMENKFAPVYRNAHVLLRPKTGLKDMYLALDPGTRAAGALPSGGTIPVANTLPDVNPDEILAQLDSDTRSYLQILLGAGGEAFTDKPGHAGEASADLRQTFKRFEPTNRDLAKIMGELSTRRQNISHVVHNFRLITDELNRTDGQLGRFVESSNVNFQALADQDNNLRDALGLFPGALTTTRNTLQKADKLGRKLGPTFQALRPFARALGPSLKSFRPFLRTSTPIIKNQLRPFTRIARPTVRDLRPTAHDLAVTTPHLRKTFEVLNALFNELAYNPPGKEEGFLFYQAWINHAGAALFETDDAHGPIRRGLVMISCGSLAVLDQVASANPQLKTLIDLLNSPKQSQVCSKATPGAPSSGTTTTPTAVLPTVGAASK